MKYIRVRWIHNFPNEPVLLYSELDDDRFETRKVEVFPDGKKGYASEAEEVGGTRLGIEPVPSITQIAMDHEFVPEEITKEEFERIWYVTHQFSGRKE